ncbi:single-stranded DNA-binding protein [Pelagerythrobacter marinus]|uniref:single-stranded DNA-binding protein n=1 Tax=Pelagerythrobacter marinus TaxID=538382 RepID=UPI003899976F
MASLNQVSLLGNLCADVETRSFQNGGSVANFRLATNESWKDKNTGERKERVEYHSIAIFNEGLVRVASEYLRKGSKVFVQGKLQTRKWQDQQGNDRYSTEVVLQGFDAKLVMLDGAPGGGSTSNTGGDWQQNAPADDLDDSIPF